MRNHEIFPSVLTSLSLTVGLFGCAVEAREDSSWTASGGDQIPGASGSVATGGASAADEGDPGDDGGVRLDVGNGDDGDTDQSNNEGCEKVDFLFIVDRSGSMADEQAKLAANFPRFMQTVNESVQAKDFHILVADSDANGGSHSQTNCGNGGTCTCSPAPACCMALCENGTATTCNGSPCSNLPLPSCDQALGSGNRTDASGADCGIAGEQRYMVQGQPNLEDTFSCLAQVGTNGSGNEMVMGGVTQAVGPLSAADGCNSGFVRDDAILVVTFLTDEDDGGVGFAGFEGGSPGNPEDWRDALVAAKNGNQDAIVVVGLMGETPGVPCTNGDAKPAPRLRSFVDMFGDRGLVGSVCADDYQPIFEQAVALIDGTCDDFVPVE